MHNQNNQIFNIVYILQASPHCTHLFPHYLFAFLSHFVKMELATVSHPSSTHKKHHDISLDHFQHVIEEYIDANEHEVDAIALTFMIDVSSSVFEDFKRIQENIVTIIADGKVATDDIPSFIHLIENTYHCLVKLKKKFKKVKELKAQDLASLAGKIVTTLVRLLTECDTYHCCFEDANMDETLDEVNMKKQILLKSLIKIIEVSVNLILIPIATKACTHCIPFL